ncbi:MAG: hypothetical protein KDA37_08345, partial [Planctomycetales bacterium]|nr:hypothetical protein [Planctomycetales bacterium]
MSALRTCAVLALAMIASRPLVAQVEYTVWDLGTFDGESFGYALNNSGETTGKSKTEASQFHAFFRQASLLSSPTDLGTFGGSESFGYGLNDAHQVAGWSRDAEQNFRAFRWNDSNGNSSPDS